jgi:thioredoxin-related protein
MNPIVDEVKREYSSKVQFEYVSMDDKAGKDRATEFGIIGYPNLLILDSEGNEYTVLKGVVPKEALRRTLDDALAQENE